MSTPSGCPSFLGVWCQPLDPASWPSGPASLLWLRPLRGLGGLVTAAHRRPIQSHDWNGRLPLSLSAIKRAWNGAGYQHKQHNLTLAQYTISALRILRFFVRAVLFSATPWLSSSRVPVRRFSDRGTRPSRAGRRLRPAPLRPTLRRAFARRLHRWKRSRAVLRRPSAVRRPTDSFRTSSSHTTTTSTTSTTTRTINIRADPWQRPSSVRCPTHRCTLRRWPLIGPRRSLRRRCRPWNSSWPR